MLYPQRDLMYFDNQMISLPEKMNMKYPTKNMNDSNNNKDSDQL